MSLGGPYSEAANNAAAALVRRGYFVAVAAGNSNDNAQNYSPGSEPSVCTVGGTAKDDTRYNMSNWGPLVDILGPAVDIYSTFPSSRYVSHLFKDIRDPLQTNTKANRGRFISIGISHRYFHGHASHCWSCCLPCLIPREESWPQPLSRDTKIGYSQCDYKPDTQHSELACFQRQSFRLGVQVGKAAVKALPEMVRFDCISQMIFDGCVFLLMSSCYFKSSIFQSIYVHMVCLRQNDFCM